VFFRQLAARRDTVRMRARAHVRILRAATRGTYVAPRVCGVILKREDVVMNSRHPFINGALHLFVGVALLLCLSGAARGQTQTDEHRFEIGGLYTALDLKTFDETVNGLGGRLGYNFNRYVALDAEASFFPARHLGNDQLGEKAQAFLGVKAGARSRLAARRRVRQAAPRRHVHRRVHHGLRL